MNTYVNPCKIMANIRKGNISCIIIAKETSKDMTGVKPNLTIEGESRRETFKGGGVF